jgi:pimeloyl-ACP methyl ester carboxylesterase
MTKYKSRFPFFAMLLVLILWLAKGKCQHTLAENKIIGPEQSLQGPGGMDYLYDSIAIYDYAQEPDGFYLYLPKAEGLTELPLVVFVHGYGAYNPMVYGKWIKHLVRKGNAVVFPRYQKNLYSPSTEVFIPNTITAIRNAIQMVDSVHHVKPLLDNFALVGHSYGGVIAAGITAAYADYGIPQPKVLLLCAPGSGPFKGGVLESYEGIPSDTKLVCMVNENDKVVGDKLGVRVFKTAIHTPNRNLIRQYVDKHEVPNPICAEHNECYALDEELDNGIRNRTANRALRVSEFNALDYNGYWKIFDALMACSERGAFCEMALGDTELQKSLGHWSDGKEIRPLEVVLPEGGVLGTK